MTKVQLSLGINCYSQGLAYKVATRDYFRLALRSELQKNRGSIPIGSKKCNYSRKHPDEIWVSKIPLRSE